MYSDMDSMGILEFWGRLTYFAGELRERVG